MPMIDVTYPEGALEAGDRDEAVEKLTEALLRLEGAPVNDETRAMSWVVVHELPADLAYVAGRPVEPPIHPIYRVWITLPEGTLLDGPGPVGTMQRKQLIREVTEILLAAEGTDYSDAAAARVYCLVRAVSDGNWGGLGSIFRIEDISAFANRELPQTPAAERARSVFSELSERAAAASVAEADGMADGAR